MTKSIEYLAIRKSVTEALLQGECLLESLPDGVYNKHVSNAFNASIGGHYRHCIEHFEALLGAKRNKEVNYDSRERNQALETDRDHALQRTRELMTELSEFCSEENLQHIYPVRCKISYHGDTSPTVSATLAREAMYVVVHAIHHYALIAVMCQILGISIPPGFGVAPSTAHYNNSRLVQEPSA